MFINEESSLKECISELFNERSRECDYYRTGDYWRDVNKATNLDRKFKKSIGKKQWRKNFWYIAEMDEIHGEKLAGLQDSCYKRGFNDALLLMGEIERAKNGLPSIFN